MHVAKLQILVCVKSPNENKALFWLILEPDIKIYLYFSLLLLHSLLHQSWGWQFVTG